MDLGEYLDCLGMIEAKLEAKNSLASTTLIARRADLAIRCAIARDEMLAHPNQNSFIEDSLKDCLTIAIASYLLPMRLIDALDLSEPFQEFLFYCAVIWIQGRDLDRKSLDEEIIKFEVGWPKWVRQASKKRRNRRISEFEIARAFAFQRLQEVMQSG